MLTLLKTARRGSALIEYGLVTAFVAVLVAGSSMGLTNAIGQLIVSTEARLQAQPIPTPPAESAPIDPTPGGGTPARFTFAITEGTAAAGEIFSTDAARVTGVGGSAAIDITGEGAPAYAINDGPYTSDAGTIRSGQTVRVRLEAPSQVGASHSATLTIAGRSQEITVTATEPEPEMLFSGTPRSGPFIDLPLTIADAGNVYLRGQPAAFQGTSLRLAVSGSTVRVVCDWQPNCYGDFVFDAEIYAVNPNREASANYAISLRMEHPFAFDITSTDLGTHDLRRGTLLTIPVETRSVGGFNPEQPAAFNGTNLRLARRGRGVALICDWAGGCAGTYTFPVTLNSWNPDLTISETFTVTLQ